MIVKDEAQESENEDEGVKLKVIDEYQYRLINNNRSPQEGGYLDRIQEIIASAKGNIRKPELH